MPETKRKKVEVRREARRASQQQRRRVILAEVKKKMLGEGRLEGQIDFANLERTYVEITSRKLEDSLILPNFVFRVRSR